MRRQAKVADDRRKVTGKAKEPVAGTSRGTTEMCEGKTARMAKDGNDKSQKGMNKETAPAAYKRRRHVGDQQRSTGLSQAKINVMKTMIYIIVCFALCWMPRATYSVYKKLTVTCTKLLLNSILAYTKCPARVSRSLEIIRNISDIHSTIPYITRVECLRTTTQVNGKVGNSTADPS